MTAITCNSKSWASLLACSGLPTSLPAVAAPAAADSTLDSGLAEITVTDNLANKVTAITANNTSFQYNIPSLVRYSTNQPRTFGTEVNYRF
jgi:hypothetical protein